MNFDAAFARAVGSDSEALAGVYHREYWGPAGCDAVPDALKYVLFQAAMLYGVGQAIRMLQHAVHEPEDGSLSPALIQAVSSAEPTVVLFRFEAARRVAS